MKKWLVGLGVAAVVSMPSWSQEQVQIEVTIPVIEGPMYYRPYVSVWVEDQQGDVIKNLAVWSKEPDWLKDMRRWWRKTGRYGGDDIDAVSGATKRPGVYELVWDGRDASGNPVKPGQYSLHFEAAREHGSRSWVHTAIEVGAGQHLYTLEPSEELGEIRITTGVVQ